MLCTTDKCCSSWVYSSEWTKFLVKLLWIKLDPATIAEHYEWCDESREVPKVFTLYCNLCLNREIEKIDLQSLELV